MVVAESTNYGPPHGVPTGYLSGDGSGPDIVTTNAGNNTISVLEVNQDGLFADGTEAQTYSVGSSPDAIAVNQYTGVVVANAGDGTVSELLPYSLQARNVSASLAHAATLPVGSKPSAVVVGNLGYGQYGFVVANQGDGTVGVHLFNYDGSVGSVDECVAGDGPSAVALGSFNPVSYTDTDIAVADYNDAAVSLLYSNGNLADFTPGKTLHVGDGPDAIAVADFANNGESDIVTANRLDGTVTVLLRQPDGSFAPPETYEVGNEPDAVAVGDVSGDGIPDIVTANYADGTVSVLMGNGDGTFQNAETFSVGADPTSVAVKAFSPYTSVFGSYAGPANIVTANAGDNTVSVLFNNGSGTDFTSETLAVGDRPQSVALADVNHNDQMDILTANAGDNTISLILGRGGADGGFRPALTYSAGSSPSAIALNRNGVVVVANSGDGTVTELETETTQSAGNGLGTVATLPVGAKPGAIVVGNIDDGLGGFVVANRGDGTVAVHLFDYGTPLPVDEYPVGDGPSALALGSFDRSGFTDIAVANYYDGTVSLLYNNGSGTDFNAGPVLHVGNGPDGIAVADFANNGETDIVTANRLDGTVSVLMRKQDGSFAPAETYKVGDQPDAVAVGDLNGDGIPDIVTANYGDGTVSILMGNGNGTFRDAETFSVGPGPTSVALTTLYSNGPVDIVTSNAGDNTVSILRNDGQGTNFAPPQTLSVGNDPQSILIGKMNQDGHPEIMTVNSGDGTISLLSEGDGVDGAFQSADTYSVGTSPAAIALNQSNGLLAVANVRDGTVTELFPGGSGGGGGYSSGGSTTTGGGYSTGGGGYSTGGGGTSTGSGGGSTSTGDGGGENGGSGTGGGTGQSPFPSSIVVSFVTEYGNPAEPPPPLHSETSQELQVLLDGGENLSSLLTPFSSAFGEASGNSLLQTPPENLVPTDFAILAPAPLAAPVAGDAPNFGAGPGPTFTWSPVDGARKYRLVVATNPSDLPTATSAGGGSSVIIDTTTSSTSVAPAIPLKGDQVYYWEVIGQSPDERSSWSSVHKFSLPAPGKSPSSLKFDPKTTDIVTSIVANPMLRVLVSHNGRQEPTVEAIAAAAAINHPSPDQQESAAHEGRNVSRSLEAIGLCFATCLSIGRQQRRKQSERFTRR